MRIAIVNDTPIAVETMRRIVKKEPNYKLAWVAYDGMEAVGKCAADTPDLILMDVLMPSMDGVEATKRIMSQSPCAILMVTASINRYAAQVFEAIGYGALDAINTPAWSHDSSPENNYGLLQKIATIARLIGKSSRQQFISSVPSKPSRNLKQLPPLIVIGASTGGPKALTTILSQFSQQNFHAAIAIVQHLDAQFAPSFASWLNEQTSLSVELASVGCLPEPGKVLVAGTNHHLVMRSNLTLGYSQEPVDCFYRPSVDVFFTSVARHWPNKGIGVLLTGMGGDGARGLSLLRQAGWHTIAQDEKTCVVYGMPKAAVDLGAAIEVLPVEAIACSCIKYLPMY
jgi:two-component system, chemotaxis family, response regulator WspF